MLELLDDMNPEDNSRFGGLENKKHGGMTKIKNSFREPEAQNLSEFSWKKSSMTLHASRRETIEN